MATAAVPVTAAAARCLGDGVIVRNIGGERGRCVVSSAELPAGHVVVDEPRPFAGALLPSCAEFRCAACLRDGQAGGTPLLRCARCKATWYCSPACQRSDWKADHRHECGAVPGLITDPGLSDGAVADCLLLGRTLRKVCAAAAIAAGSAAVLFEFTEPSVGVGMGLAWRVAARVWRRWRHCHQRACRGQRGGARRRAS